MTDTRVAILGSSALNRYTTGILVHGFLNEGWSIVPLAEAPALIAQVHGAPHSYEEDRIILSVLRETFTFGKKRVVVLIHRPDEVQTRLPELEAILQSAPPGTAVALLGPRHGSDPFFGPIRRVIIPHGFYEGVTPPHQQRIVVGAHTSWGEMRSIEAACLLLKSVFHAYPEHSILGYLGGTPEGSLNVEVIQEHLGGIVSARPILTVREPLEAYSGPPVVLVNPTGRPPHGLEITFNVQLYHLGERIRTGESSGSAHTGVSIPVIWEMNGAEDIEDLAVIKIPYRDERSWRSADFERGAKLIADTIQRGDVTRLIAHNAQRSREMSPRWVANQYIELLSQLGRSEWVFH